MIASLASEHEAKVAFTVGIGHVPLLAAGASGVVPADHRGFLGTIAAPSHVARWGYWIASLQAA